MCRHQRLQGLRYNAQTNLAPEFSDRGRHILCRTTLIALQKLEFSRETSTKYSTIYLRLQEHITQLRSHTENLLDYMTAEDENNEHDTEESNF